jgi:hypothetical protein
LSAITGLALASAATAQSGPPPKQTPTPNQQLLWELVNNASKPQCNDVSPTHPCKGNNGFGNGGGDGSPNGKDDKDR